MEAVAWHQLGRVAQEQNEWTEAEHCYLESLRLDELYDNTVSAAGTMDDLAIVVIFAGRPVEAESWFKRAIALHEQIHPGGSLHAKGLSNLAALLLKEVQAGNTPVTRLTEAQSYAEQALKIQETLDASSAIWLTLDTLARITELQGQTKAAQDYRRRERETFAAFAGNRYLIDSQYRQLIVDLAAVAKGDTEAQVRSEAVMPQMKVENKPLANAIERIWTGERDWHSLVKDLDRSSALLVLLVLETIAQP
jgi:tetratricopeptide (TPR) repeat protein